MNKINDGVNHGVIIIEPNPGDYIAGATSPLEIEIINPSGDNRKYKPSEEHQSGKGADKMDCVTVSGSGCIETVIMILIDIKKLPQTHIDWLNKWKFIDKDGLVKLSTRWAAIQNGTTQSGNGAAAVGEWYRKNGFISEYLLPNNQDLEWNGYYDKSCLTDEMRQCAKESLEMFSLNYEWILKGDQDIIDHCKRGAVQILTAVCPGWSTKNPIPACSLAVQHATELLNVESDGKKDIWDSYDPHNKVFAADYPVPYKMLYLVKPIIKESDNKILMTIIKKQGSGTLFAQVGDVLIPFNTTFDMYQVDFSTAKIIELTPTEFAKFKVASKVAITKI